MNQTLHRLMTTLLIALSLLSVACGSGGETTVVQPSIVAYYVNASTGSDTNAGTSAGSPWKSLAKVSSTTFSSGTTIYLKRDCVWNEALTLSSSRIRIDAYGSGALPKLDGARDISGWTDEGAGLFSTVVALQVGEMLGNVSENGTLLAFLPWTTNAALTFQNAPTGTFSFDYPQHKIYLKPSGAPGTNAYRASVKPFGIQAMGQQNLSIRNVELSQFSLHGVHLDSCLGSEVRDAKISACGGAVIGPNPAALPDYLYAGNGVALENATSNCLVENVEIRDVFDSGISPQTFRNGQRMAGITLRNCRVERAGFAGIELSILGQGGATGSSITGVTISGMTLLDSGRGWSGQRYGTEGHGLRIKADTGAGVMSEIKVDTTAIRGSAGDGVYPGGPLGRVLLERMDIQGNAHGVQVAEPFATDLRLVLTTSLVWGNRIYGIGFDAPSAAGLDLWHNTFFDNGTIHVAIFHQSGTAKIQTNIFAATSPMAHLYIASTLSGATLNNNAYTNLPTMIGYNGAAYATVSAFNLATGFESQGISGNLALINPGVGNFTLLSTSPCRGRGDTAVGVLLDHSGFSFRTPPSCGALEYR